MKQENAAINIFDGAGDRSENGVQQVSSRGICGAAIILAGPALVGWCVFGEPSPRLEILFIFLISCTALYYGYRWAGIESVRLFGSDIDAGAYYVERRVDYSETHYHGYWVNYLATVTENVFAVDSPGSNVMSSNRRRERREFKTLVYFPRWLGRYAELADGNVLKNKTVLVLKSKNKSLDDSSIHILRFEYSGKQVRK